MVELNKKLTTQLPQCEDSTEHKEPLNGKRLGPAVNIVSQTSIYDKVIVNHTQTPTQV